MEKYACFGGVEATEADLSLSSWKFREVCELTVEGEVYKKSVCSIFETFMVIEAEVNYRNIVRITSKNTRLRSPITSICFLILLYRKPIRLQVNLTLTFRFKSD